MLRARYGTRWYTRRFCFSVSGFPAAQNNHNAMDTFLEFTGNHTLLVTALMVSFFLLIATELRRKAAGMINIEPADAIALMNNDAMVIDVRSADAYANGHIVNARNIPFDELSANEARLNQFKPKPVVTVCDTGMTSVRAVDALKKQGFENVYGIKGGMNAWSQAGLPVVSARKGKKKK